MSKKLFDKILKKASPGDVVDVPCRVTNINFADGKNTHDLVLRLLPVHGYTTEDAIVITGSEDISDMLEIDREIEDE